MNTVRNYGVILFVMLFIGCSHFQSVNQDPVSNSVNLISQYEMLEETFFKQFNTANKEEKIWLSDEVAPKLDKLRALAIRYGKVALKTENMGEDKDAKLEAIALLRELSNQLL